jgi:hypothetical protein
VAVMNSAVILLARPCPGSQHILRLFIYALSERQRAKSKAVDPTKVARENGQNSRRVFWWAIGMLQRSRY